MILRHIGLALDRAAGYVETHYWAGAALVVAAGLLVTFGDVLQAVL